MKNSDTIDGLMQKYRTGVLSRRTFMLRAAALGVSLPMAAALAGGPHGASAAPSAQGGLNLRRAQEGGVELTVAHGRNGQRHTRSLGSSASRKPSPTKL